MKVTIIGGNGHVGKFLVPTLRERGHQVLVADLTIAEDNDQQMKAHALSSSQVGTAIRDADLVVHMAMALAFTDQERYDPEFVARTYGVNVGSVVTCLEQCRDLDKPMVHISSMSVYENYGRVPVDPDGPGDSTSNYGLTKRLAEIACREFADKFAMRVTSLRLAFPTPDEFAPRWLLPRRTEVVQQRMDDGTPVAALSSTQLAMAIEDCLDMPVGHRVLATTAAPETLLVKG